MRTKKRRVLSFISLSFALIIMTTLMLGSVVMAAPTSDMLVIDNADMLTKEEELKFKTNRYRICRIFSTITRRQNCRRSIFGSR